MYKIYLDNKDWLINVNRDDLQKKKSKLRDFDPKGR